MLTGEGAEPVLHNGRLVHEYIGSVLIVHDEAVALLHVEELNFASGLGGEGGHHTGHSEGDAREHYIDRYVDRYRDVNWEMNID